MITKEEALLEVKKSLLLDRHSVLLNVSEPNSFEEEELVSLLLTVCEEIKRYGYRLSEDAIAHFTKDELVEFHQVIFPSFIKNGLHEDFKPLYPGFPKQVIEADKKKLWEDQHKLYKSLDYNSFIEEHPWYTQEEVYGPTCLSNIEVFTFSDVYRLFENFLIFPGTLAEGDQKLLYYLLIAFPEFKIPERIPNKTHQAIVLSCREDIQAKDVNDILRLIALKSGYKIESGKTLIPFSITKKIRPAIIPDKKVPKISHKIVVNRATRKEIVTKLSEVIKQKGIENCVTDAKKYYPLWVRFSKRYHFGDYRNSYPEVATFVHTLFTSEELKKLTTWNSKLHKLYHVLNADNFNGLVNFILKRPGEYMRRFDSLIRKAIELKQDPEQIVDNILDLNVNTKLLLEVLNYYDKRKAGAPRLIYAESGELMKRLDPLPELSDELIMYINYTLCMKIYKNIQEHNQDGDSLSSEKVYLSEDLKYVPVPYNMKGSGNLVARGTKMQIPKNTRALRLFIRWIDEKGCEDLDLHGTFIDELEKCTHIGWNNSFVRDYGVFSGDIRRKQGNCAEYIDINLDESKIRFKYIIATVHNYEGRGLNTLKSWIGFEYLDRYGENLNNTYYPEDVDFLEPLEVSYPSMAAFMVNLEKMEITLLNTDLNVISHSGKENAIDIVKFFNSDPTFTAYNIAHAWYTARGAEIVETPEEATKIVDIDTLKDYTEIQRMLTL